MKPEACLSTQYTIVEGEKDFYGTLLRFYGTQSIEFQNTKVLILLFMCCVYFINHLKNDQHLHYERKLISFLTQNSVHLYTKVESVNVVYLNNISL